MILPLHEIAALGTATCWATTAILAGDAVRALGAFHFNLLRQGFVAMLLAGIVFAGGRFTGLGPEEALILAASGVIGILLGDTLNFAAVGRIGPGAPGRSSR